MISEQDAGLYLRTALVCPSIYPVRCGGAKKRPGITCSRMRGPLLVILYAIVQCTPISGSINVAGSTGRLPQEEVC